MKKRWIVFSGLIGWKLWAVWVLSAVVMYVSVCFLLTFALAYIQIKAFETAKVISGITNKVPDIILHTNFNVSESNGVFRLVVPEEAVGQWRFYRSVDFKNWEQTYSNYLDKESARIMMWTLFSIETNLIATGNLFYKAEME